MPTKNNKFIIIINNKFDLHDLIPQVWTVGHNLLAYEVASSKHNPFKNVNRSDSSVVCVNIRVCVWWRETL